MMHKKVHDQIKAYYLHTHSNCLVMYSTDVKMDSKGLTKNRVVSILEDLENMWYFICTHCLLAIKYITDDLFCIRHDSFWHKGAHAAHDDGGVPPLSAHALHHVASLW